MSEDFITFEQELLNTSREAIEFSKMYLEARKNSSHCFNQLQVLINKANLHTSKKSPENKIIELMADNTYGEQAVKLNQEMNDYTSTYKGLELVVKSYLAHCSALQSVIKTQISAEINENVRAKYNRSPNEA
jgi:hypothetical protein